jgi:glycosyltransferase involved in cell wall biosynthesis
MAQDPMVSICMPSYNHARYLPAALDSILAQTFRDFELIVVDDGSTDNSLDILESYTRKYPGVVRVFTHPGRQNRGIAVTLNAAIREARGKYWSHRDSDDVSYPDRLERQVAFLENHPDVGWIYGVTDFIDQDGARLDRQYGFDLSSFPDLAEELIQDNKVDSASVMVRMSCMAETGPFEPGLMYCDWEYWIRLASRYPAAFLPGAVGAYRLHDCNVSYIPPRSESPDRTFQEFRRNLDVINSLRRKADSMEGGIGRPRTKAMLDLRRTSLLFFLKDQEAAALAAGAVLQSDPSIRQDLKQLAYWLGKYNSLRLAITMIRALGFPPSWLANRALMSVLLRLGAQRIRGLFPGREDRLQQSLPKPLA